MPAQGDAQYQYFLGAIAAVIGIIGYVPYYRDIFRGTTKPHPFSWFVWALLAGIAFAAQVVKGAGPGAWASGLSTIANFGICVASLFKGERSISRGDWAYFIGALVGIVSWLVAGDPLAAVLIITLTNSLAFGPTFRKSYEKPQEETALSYLLSAVKWGLSCAALEAFSVNTWLFPLSSFLLNAALTILLLARRNRDGRLPG
jgi:hypothetical protein